MPKTKTSAKTRRITMLPAIPAFPALLAHRRLLPIVVLAALLAGIASCQSVNVKTSVDKSNAGDNSQRVTSIDNLARQLGMSVRRESPYMASLGNSDNYVVIYGPPNPGASLNGQRLANSDVLVWQKKLYVTDALASRLRSMVRPPHSAVAATPVPVTPAPGNGSITFVRGTVVLDAGHGGKDPGAPNRYGPSEKHITLDTTLRLRNYLSQRGVTVILTREGDSYPTLDDRVEVANRVRPNLFVSIHADSAPNRSAQGYTVYAARAASSQTIKAAQHVNVSLKALGTPSRGVDRADYRVLAKTYCPALLVELGFLTNASEAQALSTPQYRQQMAEAIGQGIIATLRG